MPRRPDEDDFAADVERRKAEARKPLSEKYPNLKFLIALFAGCALLGVIAWAFT